MNPKRHLDDYYDEIQKDRPYGFKVKREGEPVDFTPPIPRRWRWWRFVLSCEPTNRPYWLGARVSWFHAGGLSLVVGFWWADFGLHFRTSPLYWYQ